MELTTHPPSDSQLGYVFDTYLNTWRLNPAAGTLQNNLYFEAQRATLESLIARGATVLIAADARYPDLVQGWVCFEVKDDLPILHYIYERPGYKVIQFLLDQIPGTKPGLLTHRLLLKELRPWKLVPEIARRKSL